MNGNFFGMPFGGIPPGGGRPAQTPSEVERLFQGLLDELPDEARTLIAKLNDQAAKFEAQTEAAKRQVHEHAEQQIAEIERKADSRRSVLFDQAIEQLQPLQKELFRTGDLASALAVFLHIRSLKLRAENIQPDPVDLTQFHHQVGKTLFFRITGRSDGPVWGSDIYTSDSLLAAAAVHAGAVEAGEEAVVRVSIVNMAGTQIVGTFSNGVASSDWGSYPIGYRVSRREPA